VFAYDPVGQISAWLNDGSQQLKMVGISEFISDSEQALPSLPRTYAERMARSSVLRKEFPIEVFSELTSFAAMLSLMFVLVTLIRHWKDVSAEQKIFCFVILLGEVLNALICGALSGPHERYQSRLTWLIPLVALLLAYERWLFLSVAEGLVFSGPLAPTKPTDESFPAPALGHANALERSARN
jgi:hypothetical protein